MFYDGEDQDPPAPPIAPEPPPHAFRALERHKAALAYLYGLFEQATERAKEMLRKPGLHHDGAFHSHLIRYLVTNKARDANAQQGNRFRFFPLANTGIEILSLHDRIRVWKAVGDCEIPPTGDSTGRREFCDQPTDPTLFAPGEYAIINPGRLVLLWDLDDSYSLNRFELACPRELTSIWASPETHWKLRVPHPATWIEAAQDFNADDNDFNLDLDGLGEPDPEK